MQGEDAGGTRVRIPMEIGGDELALMHNAVLQAIASVHADEIGLADGEEVEIPGALILGILAYVAARTIATAPAAIRDEALSEFTAIMREHMGPSVATN